MSNASYDTSLTDEYIAAVKRPAEVVHDFCQYFYSVEQDGHQQETSLVKVILGSDDVNNDMKKENSTSASAVSISITEEPIAFVIRNVLTPSECDQLIDDAEYFGIREGEKYVARSAKRTKDYTNTALSEIVEGRIRHVLESMLITGNDDEDSNIIIESANSENTCMVPICGIHDNWRILRYDADGGDAFPAHQDQMDCFLKPKNDGSGRKDFIVSSHTLLLQLSNNSLEGGCTRFYPRGKMRLLKDSDNDTALRNRQFEHAVDVALPQGWALVFRQRGLLHAGQPLSVSSPCSKYVAQAGILRTLPDEILQKPANFKNGVGVTKLISYEEIANIHRGRVRT